MFSRKFLLILFFWAYSICAYTADDAGFDEICRIYTEAKNSSMPKQQLSDYVFDNVKKRVSLKDALQAHGAVFSLAPAECYAIFKQSAELSLEQSWDCDAVKILMR